MVLHVSVVGIQEVMEHAVGFKEVVYSPGQATITFLRGLVDAAGRSGIAGVPSRVDKAAIVQVSQSAVDRAHVDRILLKTEGLHALHQLVPMDLVAVYEQ
jgi:hypothetical protein